MTKSLVSIVGDLGDLDSFIVNDEFLQIVNQDPPEKFIKDHPVASGVKYIPIEIIENMLTKLFQEWNVEVLREGVMLNSVNVTVRVHYRHPISRKMRFQDGVGAVPIQTEKGKNASDLGAIKSNAIMLALPAAKTFAIKDAVEHIGKIFGRDINRRDVMAFTPSYNTLEAHENFTPMNSLITKPQQQELMEVAKESSGLVDEDKVKEWFIETCGMAITQVKKIEFDNVKRWVQEEHI